MKTLRVPFMILAMVNLLAGIWAGLIRIGWDFPVTPVAVHHGAIMVGGFLTTLIALEKAIPLKRNWLLAIPAISALSLTMTIPGYFQPGLYFMLAGSAGLFGILIYYLYLYPRDLSAALMVVGASCLLVGNVMLIQKRFYPAAFPWWMGFLLLTITAERLELSRFLPVTMKNKYLLLGFLGLFLAGLFLPFHTTGKYLAAVGLMGVAVWMLRHDVIRIGLKKEGLTRFSSVALMMANGWLILEGILMILLPQTVYTYDMMVHVFFIGFAFGMIFAHGPIILPGVLGLSSKPWHPVLYVWVFLVQASVLLRITADALLSTEWRKISGLLSGAGMLLYFLTIVVLLIRSRSKSAPAVR